MRALLLGHKKTWGVVELAKTVGISQGYAVKLIRLLKTAGIVRQGSEGCVVDRPDQLLESWANAYRFERAGSQTQYTVVGDAAEAERRFVSIARKLDTRYALTLFAGAAHRAPFVRYSTVHVYFEGNPDSLAGEMGAVQVSEGGNLAIVRPSDEGVFFGAQEIDGTRVVADAQLYVDLFNFGARGREQAEFLLEKCLPSFVSPDSAESRAQFHEALALRDTADRKYAGAHYDEAAKLYEALIGRLTLLNFREAGTELRRARLLLWMALAHTARLKRDAVLLDRARAIAVTDSDVERLRREVGYRAAAVELAILAYYVALAESAASEEESARYVNKAHTHMTIIASAYGDASEDEKKQAGAIFKGHGA